MIDTKIYCRALGCYWNIGKDEKDNCACEKIDIGHSHICFNYVTKEDAEHRIKVAMGKK